MPQIVLICPACKAPFGGCDQGDDAEVNLRRAAKLAGIEVATLISDLDFGRCDCNPSPAEIRKFLALISLDPEMRAEHRADDGSWKAGLATEVLPSLDLSHLKGASRAEIEAEVQLKANQIQEATGIPVLTIGIKDEEPITANLLPGIEAVHAFRIVDYPFQCLVVTGFDDSTGTYETIIGSETGLKLYPLWDMCLRSENKPVWDEELISALINPFLNLVAHGDRDKIIASYEASLAKRGGGK